MKAKDQDDALAAAWQAYKPDAKWPLKVSNDLPDRDGWSRRRAYEYQTSPNEKRGVDAFVYYSGSSWTVVIEDLADAVAEKRGAQLALIFSRLLPKGYTASRLPERRPTLSITPALPSLASLYRAGTKSYWASLESLLAWYRMARLFSLMDLG